MHSIALVLTWIGPLPYYFGLFLRTVEANPTIDLFVFSDQKQPLAGPNIHWKREAFRDTVARFERATSLNLGKPTSRKLCDFKPLMGAAFAEEIRDYDFWGHIDCDIVLGDLRAFATPAVLSSYDVVSFRGRGHVWGPLTLWRNSEHINRLFQLAPGYERTLTAPCFFGFDETCGRWKTPHRAYADTLNAGEPVSITDVVRTEVAERRLLFYDEDHVNENKPHLGMEKRWDKGCLYDANAERDILLYHLLYAKHDPYFSVAHLNSPGALPDLFSLTRLGVRHPNEDRWYRLGRIMRGVTNDIAMRWQRIGAGMKKRIRQ